MRVTLVFSLLLALPSFAKEATVEAVWVSGQGKDAKGGTTKVEVRTSANKSKTPAVGVIEQYVGGTGAQWRSSSWVAADVASRLAKKPLVDTEFLVKVGGHIDGPSAGMLMTATMTALLLQTPIKPDVTMTGAVNPDGTSGPVGGIPQKMKGAAAAGKKVFGYPAGGRMAKDKETGQIVDLEALAESLHMKAVEVLHARDAYALLTGKSLPTAKPLEPRAFEPTPAQMAYMRAQVDRVQTEVTASLGRIKAAMRTLSPEAQKDIAAIVKGGEELHHKADAYAKEGAYEAAYSAWIETLVTVRIAEASQEVLLLSRALDFVTLERRAKEELAAVEAAAEMRVSARSLQGAVTAVDLLRGSVVAGTFAKAAATNLSAALATYVQAQKARDKTALGRAAGGMAGPFAYAAAVKVMRLVMEAAAADVEEKESPLKSLDAFSVLALGRSSAAAAVLASVDALLLEDAAAGAGVSIERVREGLREARIEYGFAEHGMAMANAATSPLARMAGATEAYLNASSLVMRYYSLRLGEKERADSQRALQNSLDASRAEVLSTCAETHRKLGALPVAVKRSFLAAEATRGGTDEDKLGALTSYWNATLSCETASSFVR